MSRPDIFGAKLARELDKGFKKAKGSFPITLRTIRLGARNPADPTAGQAKTPTDYACRGFMSQRKRTADGGVERTASVFLIFGASLPAGVEPQPGDKIFSAAEGGRWFTIQPISGNARTAEVERDPAGATYICEVGP